MTIAIADSWEGRSSTATLDIPVSGIEIGDIIVVFTFCAGGGTPDTPFDDVANGYTDRNASTPDATFTTSVGFADAVAEFVPTQVSVSNSAGGANDVAAVVLRLTHDGTGWMHRGSDTGSNSALDDPVSLNIPISVVTMPLGGASAFEYTNDGTVLLLAAMTHDGATTTFAPEAGWTEVQEEEDASAGIPYSVVSRVDTEHFVPDPTHQWTTGAARDYSMVVGAYTEQIADIELAFVTTAPSPKVLGLTMQVDTPDIFPDPNSTTFHVLVFNLEAQVPDGVNAEFVRVIGDPGGVWDIERGQAGSYSQNIEAGWAVWRDHLYADIPQGLLQANSYMLAVALDAAGWP